MDTQDTGEVAGSGDKKLNVKAAQTSLDCTTAVGVSCVALFRTFLVSFQGCLRLLNERGQGEITSS